MSLADLTSLNRRLLALAQVEGTTAAEEEADPDDIFGTGSEEAGYEDQTEEDEEEGPEVRGRFKTVDPLEFNRVKEWIELNVFGGSAQGQAGVIDAFVNEWDTYFRATTLNNADPTQNIGTGATLEQLLENDEFINGAMWLPVTGTNQLPPLFTTALPEVDENGEPTGEVVEHIGVSSPLRGVEFKTITEVSERRTAEDAVIFNRVVRGNSDLARRVFKKALETGRAGTIPTPSGRATVTHVGDRGGEGIRQGGPASPGPVPGFAAPPPAIDIDKITELYTQHQPKSRGGGGGGGGGGTTTRRELVFDKEQLIADVSERYNEWMLSASDAPRGKITSWVDAYIREAGAFWSKKGGQLDFETFINGKLRADPRYQLLYKDKLPSESEQQYVQKFFAPIAGMGMSGDFTREQTEASILSGGSVEGQMERVQRTREVQSANQGRFSQQLANTLAGLGVQ